MYQHEAKSVVILIVQGSCFLNSLNKPYSCVQHPTFLLDLFPMKLHTEWLCERQAASKAPCPHLCSQDFFNPVFDSIRE